MELPAVRTTVTDKTRKIAFIVVAYRELTKTECHIAIRHWVRQNGNRLPKKGTSVTIVTTIGGRD